MSRFIENNPEYVNRFKYTSCGDELFYTTVIKKLESNFEIENKNCLRFVEWHPKREYTSLPLVLNENEFGDIVSSKALFCRKVESRASANLLDMLDGYAATRTE